MNTVLFFSFLLLSLPISSLAQYSCFVRGELKGLDHAKVQVYEHTEEHKIQLAGQTELVQGKFFLQLKCAGFPVISFQIGQERSTKLFFLTEGVHDTLIFEGEKQFAENWRLNGLREQADFEVYAHLNAKMQQIRTDYAAQLKSLPFPQMNSAKDAYQLEFLHNKAAFLGEMAAFIETNRAKEVALYALHRHFLYERDVTMLEKLYAQLPPRKNVLSSQIEKAIEYGQTTKFGTKLENFALTTDTGKSVQLTDFQGKYLLIEFWASWCRPCLELLPSLHDLYLHQDKLFPFEVLAIATDKDSSAWRDALKNHPTQWVNVIDMPDFQQAIAKKYKVGLIPANFLLNEKGEVVGKNLSIGELREKLQKPLPDTPKE